METNKKKEKIIITRQQQIEFENGLIIIGANGSGKTRMGVEIEANPNNNTARIYANKSLCFPGRIWHGSKSAYFYQQQAGVIAPHA